MSELGFVNHRGEPVGTAPVMRKAAPKREQPESFHNGFVVQGHPPGALEAAKEAHRAATKKAQEAGQVPPAPWDEQVWTNRTKRKRVRARPYEIHDAALTCKELAEKLGWTGVEVVALSKGNAPRPF